MNRFVYADNAATTPVSDSVFDAMLPFLKEKYGNASSIYSIAHEAKFAIEDARKQVAEALGAAGIRVSALAELRPALEKAIAMGRPVLIDCQIDQDDKVFPMVPAGAPIEEAFDQDDV